MAKEHVDGITDVDVANALDLTPDEAADAMGTATSKGVIQATGRFVLEEDLQWHVVYRAAE